MDNVEVPELTLPPSSEDLLIKGRNLMRTISIYEILRRFQQNLRLTPFRFEDFCVSLLIDEQTYLLSEIHIQLLKALIREDDLVGMQHGPQDVRDAINIYLYLCDPMTWPEVTRIYLSTDYKKNAKLFNDSLAVNYPFASLEQKLILLEYFCEEFLTSASCREVLNNEGTIKHDDNCRGCHRTGDLLCCDTCPAVFHLGCLDPPLKQVPEDVWTCPICNLNSVTGVTDCVSDLERLGYCSRQEPIGWDRHGRKYWFLCRRLIVEDQKDADQVAYYSSRLQFDELLASLDAEHYESDLCAALAELKEEIYRQMQITEKLTKMAKGTRKSFLEAINEELFFKREAKLKAKIAEAEEAEEKAAIEEQLADLETKLAVDENDKRSHQIDGSGVLTRLKTGSIQPKTVSMDSFKNRISSYNNFSAVRDEETVILLKDNLTLTRELRKTLPTSYLAMNLFKLGMEGNYRQYQNIYSVNKFALNKAQLAEECDKKRHLSHKFSLTEASELKWTPQTTTSAHSAPSIHGTRIMMVNILRQTLLILETQLTLTFMHPNWSVHRSNWIKAVTMCSEAKEFLLAMHILESSMKPVLFNIAWHDSLGFSVLQPSTQAERDKLKKREKKDRKEGGGGGGGNANESMAVDSSEPSSAAGRFNGAGIGVRLVCGKLKHQIWKQKGEEFRLSGIGGWQWVSSTRVRPQEALGATGKKEEEKEEEEELATEEAMEATDDMEPSVINISAALSDETPAKDRKYSKVTSSPSSSRLDSLLKTRLDLYAFYKRQEKEAATATADATSAAADKKAEEEQKTAKTANSGGFSTYRCYSAICHSTGQLSSSQQLKCYSPLCIYHHQKATNSSVKEEATEAVVEKLSPLDDPAEHVELLEVKAVGGANVPVPIRKIVPFKSVLPPATRFMVGKYKSMLILPLYEMRKLGRNGGLREVIGFNYVCKSNNVNWPYGQTPRPSLRLMWLWRTACLGTLHAVAHQLRVLWAAVRWDDIQYMLTKPPSSSSVKTITTESEVTTVEILRRRDLPPFGLRSQYLMRKIIGPIDLPSTPSCEVSTPIRSGLRQRKRPVSPPVKGPRMEEIWLNEEELELWEIRQFAERAIMEERKRQAELRQKAAAELRKSNASTPISANRAQLVNGARNSTTTTPTTNSPLNINTKQAISSRLSSIFQNRAANRVLASASPVVNSGTITPTTTTTTYATIRTANGTFRVPVHNKPGAPPNQLFLRTGGQIITSSSTAAAQQGSTSVIQGGNVIVTSNAVSGSGGITPTRPGTYIVRVPANAGAGGGLGTAKPLIISNVGSWSNGALPDIVRGGNPNIKQAVPLIEPKGPQKISTGTTVNAIQATSSSSSSAAKSTTPAQSTAAVTTTTGAINIVTPLSTTPTIGKGIQCVQLKTSDGRTHLLPISSLPTAPGQTFQIALNSGGSGTPLRLITTSTAVNNKPVDNGKGQTTYMISAGSSAFVPGANGGQKVILQQQQSANSITSTNSTTVTPATDSSFKVMVEPTTAGSSAKTNLVTAPATTATTTALITSSSSKPAAPAPAEPPKAFELTPEVTQEIVRKALMDASLPHGTSQKLLAYQKRHRQLNKLDGGAAPVGAASADDDDGGDHDGSLGSSSSTSKAKKQIGASGRSGSYYASATSRLMDSVSSSSRPSRISSAATSSRSSRPSRGNSRYDNSDFFTDFTPASKKHLDRSFAADEEDGGLEKGMMTGDDEFDALDQVDRVCAGVLNGLLKKVEKGEKMARRAELREERNQKLVVASRLKYRQSHIEVMRRSIERRKAQLNISIRLHVEEKLNGQFTKEEEAAAPKSKSVKKRKLTDADHVDADTPPTSKQANRGGGKAAKRPKVTVISQSPASSFPATNSISHNDDNDTADAAATVIGQTPKPSQARMKTTRSKLNGSTTSSTTSSNSITTAAKLSKNFSSIRQTKKAMKAQSRVDICQVTSESSESSAAATASPATYCICQQAYDANKFYICCDRCQGWFHGRCVGITSVVAETIDDYICPQCEGDNSINYRNIKELSAEDYQALMKIVKSIQGHVQAQPFLRPVCKKKVPDYYTVIEEPMDLKTIETRLKNKIYKSFAELNYDMNKIFDNCLIYNGRTSHYSHYAETLKENFNELVDEFRENDR